MIVIMIVRDMRTRAGSAMPRYCFGCETDVATHANQVILMVLCNSANEENKTSKITSFVYDWIGYFPS
jgi:hypothetical protein